MRVVRGFTNPQKLYPANVWMPSEQIHHRRAAADCKPPNNGSLSLRCGRAFSSPAVINKGIATFLKAPPPPPSIHHAADSPPLRVN